MIVTTILVIGSERLYSSMMRNYDNKPSTSASAAASDERITVVKLSKSGGCVDRDASFMKATREGQIRSYFFGNPIPSTAASALSLSASLTTNVTLSPHAQQLDLNSLSIYSISNPASSSTSDDEDDYDPAQLSTTDSFLPGGSSDAAPSSYPQNESTAQSSDPQSAISLKKLPSPAPAAMANSLLAISHAAPSASTAEIRDSSIMGFLYVADVDTDKAKIRVLAPVGGRVPSRALVWGRKWPGEVVGLVG